LGEQGGGGGGGGGGGSGKKSETKTTEPKEEKKKKENSETPQMRTRTLVGGILWRRLPPSQGKVSGLRSSRGGSEKEEKSWSVISEQGGGKKKIGKRAFLSSKSEDAFDGEKKLWVSQDIEEKKKMCADLASAEGGVWSWGGEAPTGWRG